MRLKGGRELVPNEAVTPKNQRVAPHQGEAATSQEQAGGLGAHEVRLAPSGGTVKAGHRRGDRPTCHQPLIIS